MEPAKPVHSAGVMARSPVEIERVLVALLASRESVLAVLDDGKLQFRSRIVYIDPGRRHIVVEASGDAALDTALIARPRVTFTSSVGDVHLEFPVADPQPTMHDGGPAIRLRFPEVLVSHPQRAVPRASVPAQPPLKCIADADGIAPFDGFIVDIGIGGIGYLVYSADITIEPGTVLKGCRIERPGKRPVHVDLEVRYSRPISLADGRPAIRSGCRFVNPSNDLLKLISSFMGVKT